MSGSGLFYNGKKCAYVPSVVDWARKSGLLVPKAKAKKGDLVIFDFGGRSHADHIGLCVKNLGGSLLTIEGNTSVSSDDNGGEVMHRTRSLNLISYVIRPKWQNGYTARTFVMLAKSQIGIHESPSNSNIVKYSKEYGLIGPWCCMFIWWLFKHMEKSQPSNYPTVKYGVKSLWVGKAKKILYKKGYRNLNLGRGLNVFGRGTLNAVHQFQKKNKLPVKNYIDAKMWVKLCK